MISWFTESLCLREASWSSRPIPMLKQGHLEQVAQDHGRAAFEYLQRWRPHSLSGQYVPVFDYIHGNKAKPKPQTNKNQPNNKKVGCLFSFTFPLCSNGFLCVLISAQCFFFLSVGSLLTADNLRFASALDSILYAWTPWSQANTFQCVLPYPLHLLWHWVCSWLKSPRREKKTSAVNKCFGLLHG